MPFDVQFAAKFFFDRASVKNAVDAGKRRALSKFGAFVRQRAKTSIRKRKGTSPPGKPPYSHTDVLRKFIFFGFDPRRQSVVIGPVPAGSQTGAPERLEKGVVGALVGRKVARYEPRPFMAPAFKAELLKAPQVFKDQIR